MQLSANSAALDLANSRTPVPENYNSNGRHHHHAAHHSLGWLADNSVESSSNNTTTTAAATTSAAATTNGLPSGNYHSRHVSHQSMESNLSGFGSPGGAVRQPNNNTLHGRPTSLQLSYSTNDIPTSTRHGSFHNDSASRPHVDIPQNTFPALGRIPSTHHSGSSTNTTPPTPQSSDLDEQSPNILSPQSSFQSSNGAPISTVLPSSSTVATTANGSTTPTPSTFATPVYGYGIQAYAPNHMQVNGNHAQLIPNHSPFGSYGGQPYTPYSRFSDSPRTSQSRRSGDSDSSPLSRFGNVPLEDYQGELYGMCKDQHGCRYLQRKLEEGIPENVQTIFRETQIHVVELMTGE